MPSALRPYQLQAAIAAVHDEAPTADLTDWPQVLALNRWSWPATTTRRAGYQEAARRTTSEPERRHLLTRAARLG
jgi:hypothetical protein